MGQESLKSTSKSSGNPSIALVIRIKMAAWASVLLSPILPAAAAKLAEQLQLPNLTTLKLADLHWGLVPDHHTIAAPQPIFPRIVSEKPA
jgi:methionyl-tRNA synthetase